MLARKMFWRATGNGELGAAQPGGSVPLSLLRSRWLQPRGGGLGGGEGKGGGVWGGGALLAGHAEGCCTASGLALLPSDSHMTCRMGNASLPLAQLSGSVPAGGEQGRRGCSGQRTRGVPCALPGCLPGCPAAMCNLLQALQHPDLPVSLLELRSLQCDSKMGMA